VLTETDNDGVFQETVQVVVEAVYSISPDENSLNLICAAADPPDIETLLDLTKEFSDNVKVCCQLIPPAGVGVGPDVV
jgi:hypothetical protein